MTKYVKVSIITGEKLGILVEAGLNRELNVCEYIQLLGISSIDPEYEQNLNTFESVCSGTGLMFVPLLYMLVRERIDG
jgi:hypothetical protein